MLYMQKCLLRRIFAPILIDEEWESSKMNESEQTAVMFFDPLR